MRRYVDWYILWLKVYVRRSSTWLQLLGMLLLLLLLSVIKLPSGDNLKVGIVKAEGEYGNRIIRELLQEESIFQFSLYEDTESLKHDVLGGKLECGFFFSDDLDRKIQEGNWQRTVNYVATPFSVKGVVARETVYACFFEVFSEEILKQREGELFWGEDPARSSRLVELKRDYADSNSVFHLEIMKVETVKEAEPEVKTRPLQGMVGLLIFFTVFMAEGRRFKPALTRTDRALNPAQRFLFGFLDKLAAGTLPTLVGWGVLCFLELGRTSVKEGALLIGFLLLSSLWSQVVGPLVKNETAFIAGAFSLVLMHLLLCPIFFDISTFLPAAEKIRMIFPLSVYLLFCT